MIQEEGTRQFSRVEYEGSKVDCVISGLICLAGVVVRSSRLAFRLPSTAMLPLASCYLDREIRCMGRQFMLHSRELDALVSAFARLGSDRFTVRQVNGLETLILTSMQCSVIQRAQRPAAFRRW